MILKESDHPGQLLTDCMECGAIFHIHDFRHEIFADTVKKCLEKVRLCPHCEALQLLKEKEAAKLEKEKYRLLELRNNLPQILEKAGIPRNYIFDRQTGKPFTSPPARWAAEYLWLHRDQNILLSGVTGSGKSTAACFVAWKMMEEKETRIRYYGMSQLLSLWRAARRSDDPDADIKFLFRLFRDQEVTIIDEVVGKAKVSDSGQELLFDILEAVNNGECRSKIWLLGNFYTGSIEAIFADPDPVRRRLAENFDCVRLVPEEQKVVKIPVWRQK